MSQPLKALQRLVAPRRSLRGIVTAIVADRLQVATPFGLREYPGVDGVDVGDQVTVTAAEQVTKPRSGGAVYWL